MQVAILFLLSASLVLANSPTTHKHFLSHCVSFFVHNLASLHYSKKEENYLTCYYQWSDTLTKLFNIIIIIKMEGETNFSVYDMHNISFMRILDIEYKDKLECQCIDKFSSLFPFSVSKILILLATCLLPGCRVMPLTCLLQTLDYGS